MATGGHKMKEFTVIGQERAEACSAQPHRTFKQCVEHRNQITGRGIDDLQYLGRRGLLLKRLAQLGQEPRILDGDDRLVGEGAHQLDLPLGERLDPLPGEINRAEHLPPAQQRHNKVGTSPGRDGLGHRVIRDSANVRDMHDPTFEQYPPGEAVATRNKAPLAQSRP